MIERHQAVTYPLQGTELVLHHKYPKERSNRCFYGGHNTKVNHYPHRCTTADYAAPLSYKEREKVPTLHFNKFSLWQGSVNSIVYLPTVFHHIMVRDRDFVG